MWLIYNLDEVNYKRDLLYIKQFWCFCKNISELQIKHIWNLSFNLFSNRFHASYNLRTFTGNAALASPSRNLLAINKLVASVGWYASQNTYSVRFSQRNELAVASSTPLKHRNGGKLPPQQGSFAFTKPERSQILLLWRKKMHVIT